MADSPLTFAGLVTLLNTAPVITQAVYSLAFETFTLTFDQTLHSQSIDPTSLTFRLNNETVTVLTAVASNNLITGTASVAAGPPQSDQLDYSATPAGIRNTKLNPAAAFTNFPVSAI